MSRRPRIFIPGIPAHVYLRGNDRQDIFLADGDRLYFVQCLREAAVQSGLAIHAYVLMTNHVHLLATASRPRSLGRVFQDTGRRYVRYFNHRHCRTGTLFEGRYKSTLVQAERYYFACHRYIERNPVRAGMVAHPGEHPWSSFGHYASGRGDSLITPHERVQGDPGWHRNLFEGEESPEDIARIRTCTHRGWALGDPSFCDRVGASLGFRVVPIGRGKGRRKRDDGVIQKSLLDDRVV